MWFWKNGLKKIPNLPFNFFILIDNAFNNSIKINKPLNASQKKETIMDWLSRKSISFCLSSRKIELLDLEKHNSSNVKTCIFDSLIKEHGHAVFRHNDLDVIKHLWAKLENCVSSRIITKDIGMSNLLNLLEKAMNKYH